MLRNKLVRSDGSIIDSSVIISCEFTEEVNSGENLTVGDITSSEINLEILSTDMVEQDEVLTYYIIEDGVETKIGVFNAEKPSVASRTSIKFSAYDNVAKSEKIFSGWLRDNRDLFPMTLAELVTKACEFCGLTIASTTFPQSGIEIGAFYADDITCRQILAWAGEIAGRFIRANSAGEIEFAWYEDVTQYMVAPGAEAAANPVSVTDDGAGNISIMSETGTVADDGDGNVVVKMPSVKSIYREGVVTLVSAPSIAYKVGGLSYEAYSTDLINRVQLKQTDDDIGVIYPEEATGNCFSIRGNMLLATCGTDAIMHVAMTLYNQLRAITYVPAKVTLSRTIAIRAGDIISIRDSNGTEISTYVMKMSVTPSGTSLESTGNKSYDSNAAVASEKFVNTVGKILEIKKTVDGLVVKNEDLSGKVSGLELSTEQFKTYVEETYVSEEQFGEYRSEFEQTARGFEMRFENVEGSIDETNAHIRYGELYRKDPDTPVYGIEIGQRTAKNGETTFDAYAQFSSEKMAFYDENGYEAASISDTKMSIPNADVSVSLKTGGFVDTVLGDKGVVSKWVGGV